MANQQEQQVMAAFVQWLPQNITKFQGQIPDEVIAPIANAKDENEVVNVLNQLSQSEEGNQLVAGMFQAFQQEQTGMFKKGGKLSYLLNKFQPGGVVEKEVKVKGIAPKTVTIPIVERNVPAAAGKNRVRIPNIGNVKDRHIGGAVGTDGRQVLSANESVNRNSAITTITVPAPGDTLVKQAVMTDLGWDERNYPKGSSEYRSVLDRLGSKGTPMWTALDRISQLVKSRNK